MVIRSPGAMRPRTSSTPEFRPGQPSPVDQHFLVDRASKNRMSVPSLDS
jgi:hypothetical protein